MSKPILFLAALLLCAAASARPADCREAEHATSGEVYVPAYSHIYAGTSRPFPLCITLSIRSLERQAGITLLSVDYLDSEGNTIARYLADHKTLKPLATISFTVSESEKPGGAGAKFLVKWTCPKAVLPPLVEAVMIGSSGQQGISFVSRGLNLP
jgi:hypothetical protein